jgi:hypothetical protein
LADKDDASEEIARVRRRLADLDAERTALARELETLELEQKLISARRATERDAFPDAPVTNSSSSAEKITLFRRLFAGRPDVFPFDGKTERPGARDIRRLALMNGRKAFAESRR